MGRRISFPYLRKSRFSNGGGRAQTNSFNFIPFSLHLLVLKLNVIDETFSDEKENLKQWVLLVVVFELLTNAPGSRYRYFDNNFRTITEHFCIFV